MAIGSSKVVALISLASVLYKYSVLKYIISFKSVDDGIAILNEQRSDLMNLPSIYSYSFSSPFEGGARVLAKRHPISLGQSQYYCSIKS